MEPGDHLGHYRILGRLGQGGMGVVYKAIDTRLDRTVAIKLLTHERLKDGHAMLRFTQEARAASALEHPNIVTIFEINEEDGRNYIAMQFVAGMTLRELQHGRPVPLADLLRFGIQISDGLACAHSRGIVHRDLKPENLMVTSEGQIKILDFGLAKLTELFSADEKTRARSKPEERGVTDEGQVLGTVAYMSPEQAQGKPVDARSDVFSFGAVLYEMATGRHAFRGENQASVLAAVLRDDPEPVSALNLDVSVELDKLISRCLRKDAARRWQSMSDIRVALTELKEESDSVRTAASGPPRGVPLPRRIRLWAALALGVAALTTAFVALQWKRGPTMPLAWRVTPVATDSGAEERGAISPDGRQVAYLWDGPDHNNTDVYVQLIGAGNPLRLTTNPAREDWPTWSPDGRYVAFTRDKEVLVVPALGGPERRIAQLSAGPPCFGGFSWHPGGDRIAITDRRSPKEGAAIHVFDIGLGRMRPLVDLPEGNACDIYPTYSPDGRLLAFVRFQMDSVSDLFVQSLDASGNAAGAPRRLTFHQTMIAGVSWSPDSRSILFSSKHSGLYALWIVGEKGGEARKLDVADDALYPAWSLTGERVIFTKSVADFDLRRIRKGASGHFGAPEPFASSTRNETNPSYSSDGAKIAFASDRSGNREVWNCDGEGSNCRQVTRSAFDGIRTISWAPNGRELAIRATQSGEASIFVLQTEDGRVRNLTDGIRVGYGPAWSQDGNWIYFGVVKNGQQEISRASPSGGGSRNVKNVRGGGFGLSSDGKVIYYQNRGKFYQVPVDDGAASVVADQMFGRPWQVTGKGIYWVEFGVKPDPQLNFFHLDTQKTARIAPLPAVSKDALSYTVAPDGCTVVYAVELERSDIYMAEPLLERKKH